MANFLKMIRKIIVIIPGVCIFHVTAFSQQHDTLNLYFDVNKYKLNTYHRVALNTLLDKYSEVTYVAITGHADTTGSDAYNLELSRKRAVSVKNYLFQIGLDTLIRDFNYYGEGRAVMPVRHTDRLFSKGSAIFNDRRVETIAGGKPIDIYAVQPVSFSKPPPPEPVPNDNIPPAIKEVKMPVTLINAKLQNDVEIWYAQGAFPDYIDNQIAHGDESLLKLTDNLNDIRQRNMVTVTVDGKFLSPAEIVCFDSFTFNNLKKDTAITVKIPLNNTIDCAEAQIKLYTGENINGTWKWRDEGENFTIEKNNGRYYASLPVNSFNGCMNFSYPVESPCFKPAKALLKTKNITVTRLRASITNINCVYIPVKQEEGTYEIFQNQTEASHVLLDIAARDNNNKVYDLVDFPLSLCKYDAKENTYSLSKKELKKFLKFY